MKQIITALFVALGFSLYAQNYNITLRSEMSFPGETVANIYGYTTPDGREYALVGASKNTHIVEVTDPVNPVLVSSIPFSNSLWKEIRVYKNVAYVTTEGGGSGVQIIDLSPLPGSTDLPNYRYYGDGAINGQLQTVHALQVDTTKGFLYLYGSNLANGGAIICDLTNPYQPVYAGQYNLNYIHDGYADNDTLYGAHISDGYFSVIDVSDKTNPVVLNTQITPNVFTHNTWITKDRKHMLTTDETSNSYLTMYDISDVTDIKELDRFQCTPGSGSIGHNTYVLDEHAITAWYTDGVSVVDCSRPSNLVQTGWYDTYPGVGSGFEGAWGVYPYFPSGNMLVSNIDPGKIYILTPTYTRACYFEGTVTDAATGFPLNNADVTMSITTELDRYQTGTNGIFKLGYHVPGQVTIHCSKLGYISETIIVDLQAGEVLTYDFELEKSPTYTISGVVKDANGTPLPEAQVSVQISGGTFNSATNSNGEYFIQDVSQGIYNIYAGLWGYKTAVISEADISANASYDIVLEKGYKDDFALDLGWTVSSTSQEGIFERAEPLGLAVQGVIVTPEQDILDDLGDACYVTGNQSLNIGEDEVSNGATILTSPVMDLTGYVAPKIRFATAFISATPNGQVTSEKLKVFINNGTITKQIYLRSSSFDSDWKTTTVTILPTTIALTDNMTVRVEVSENIPNEPAITEAAFDAFEVINGTSGTDDLLSDMALVAQPNPFAQWVTVVFPEGLGEGSLSVVNALGQTVETRAMAANTTALELGETWGSGVYFVTVRTERGVTPALKVVKN